MLTRVMSTSLILLYGFTCLRTSNGVSAASLVKIDTEVPKPIDILNNILSSTTTNNVPALQKRNVEITPSGVKFSGPGKHSMSGFGSSYGLNFVTTGYVDIKLEKLIVQGKSPDPNQPIQFRDNKIFEGGKLICSNLREIQDEPTYQKSHDGTLWFTNVQVGEPMSQDEIQAYEDDWAEYEDKKKARDAKKEPRVEDERTSLEILDESRRLQEVELNTESAQTGLVEVEAQDGGSYEESVPTYQESHDGALWLTNVQMGEPMPHDEIQAYEDDWAEYEDKKKAKDAKEEPWVEDEKTSLEILDDSRRLQEVELNTESGQTGLVEVESEDGGSYEERGEGKEPRIEDERTNLEILDESRRLQEIELNTEREQIGFVELEAQDGGSYEESDEGNKVIMVVIMTIVVVSAILWMKKKLDPKIQTLITKSKKTVTNGKTKSGFMKNSTVFLTILF